MFPIRNNMLQSYSIFLKKYSNVLDFSTVDSKKERLKVKDSVVLKVSCTTLCTNYVKLVVF